MGVPDRFAIEYPIRCLELIEAAEEHAQQRSLVGSFALLSAAAVLTIPFERMKVGHILYRGLLDTDLATALDGLKKTKFLDAPFWNGKPPETWRLSRVMAEVNTVDAWLDEDKLHPFSAKAANRIAGKPVTEVLRVIRNALAHGNIIYLNKEGREVPGDRMHFMAFLSRYEETEAEREKGETYRVAFVPEQDFLSFVKQWAGWIGGLGRDQQIAEGGVGSTP